MGSTVDIELRVRLKQRPSPNATDTRRRIRDNATRQQQTGRVTGNCVMDPCEWT